jgi:hypothetical protein
VDVISAHCTIDRGGAEFVFLCPGDILYFVVFDVFFLIYSWPKYYFIFKTLSTIIFYLFKWLNLYWFFIGVNFFYKNVLILKESA